VQAREYFAPGLRQGVTRHGSLGQFKDKWQHRRANQERSGARIRRQGFQASAGL
jgi:hypothetical protein